ncbi:DUF2085 domain-containing protein [Rurimicrobium arvi]|uniref:DUF2085 domain-containing protein n=1 Tax=Rurimicrobium arvi TaxID=2049916 RepID=UPI003CD06624
MQENLVRLSEYRFGCHGIPARCFKIRGNPMPFCARCLGCSIGHMISLVCYIFFALPGMILCLIALALMYSDWIFQNRLRLYHNNILRFATGICGGLAAGALLWKGFDYVFVLLLN